MIQEDTLSYLMKVLTGEKAGEHASCAHCWISRTDVCKMVEVDYTGFDIPDEFVVGYGLDYAQKYRNLPFIGVVEGVE